MVGRHRRHHAQSADRQQQRSRSGWADGGTTSRRAGGVQTRKSVGRIRPLLGFTPAAVSAAAMGPPHRGRSRRWLGALAGAIRSRARRRHGRRHNGHAQSRRRRLDDRRRRLHRCDQRRDGPCVRHRKRPGAVGITVPCQRPRDADGLSRAEVWPAVRGHRRGRRRTLLVRGVRRDRRVHTAKAAR